MQGTVVERVIDAISVPFSLGGKEQGTALGPSALLQSGLTNALRDVRLRVREREVEFTLSGAGATRGRIYHRKEVIDMAKRVGAEVFASLRLGHIPLVLGGDHSISIGSLTQPLNEFIVGNARVGLLWIDAHYDAHTPATTHSHYANGIPLSAALGLGDPRLGVYSKRGGVGRRQRLAYDPRHILHIGAGETDCEPEETHLIKQQGIRAITMHEIYAKGTAHMLHGLEQFLAQLDYLVVTFDLDAIREDFAPAVSFRSKGGLIASEAELIAECVASSGKLRQLEVMEYNPEFEVCDAGGVLRTAELVHRLVKKFFGK